MKLGVILVADDWETAVTSSEDSLDRYRLDVERHLGERLVLRSEASFERFFDHVITGFSRGLPPAESARTWSSRRRGSASKKHASVATPR